MLDTPENWFLSDLPPRERAIVRELLDQPWPSEQSVAELVEGHVVTLRAALQQNEFLDVGLATRIATACEHLASAIGADPAESHVRIVRAAALYFVQGDDVESDTSSILGLDDDAAVVSAAARAIGRADLAPELI